HDQPMAARGPRTTFVGVAPVYDRGRPVECTVEEFLVGLDFKTVRYSPVRVGEHSVGGHDGVAFDADWARHARSFSLRIPRDSATARAPRPRSRSRAQYAWRGRRAGACRR